MIRQSMATTLSEGTVQERHMCNQCVTNIFDRMYGLHPEMMNTFIRLEKESE